MNQTKHSSTANVAVFAAGTILGIGLGMLVAPKRGDKMRADIKDMGDKARFRLDKAKNAFRRGLREAREEAALTAREARSRLESKLDEMQPEDVYE